MGVTVAIGELVASRLASGELVLPVLAESAREVAAACAEEDGGDVRKIAGVVRRDPALAAHFLRLANCPLFATKTPIVSLPQALARLGTSQIRQVAVLVACRSSTFTSRARVSDARTLRRRSVATAIWAQEIARLRRLNVEEAFLCGLLGDVGIPVLWQFFEDLEREGMCFEARAVEEHVTALHDLVGAAVVRQWKLGERLADAIERHHRALGTSEPVGTGAGAPTEATIAAVQIADVLARSSPACDDDVWATARAHPAATALSLYAEDFDALTARSADVLATVEALT